MAYASRLGRARISARSPEAAGRCDRCGFIVSWRDLSWQYDWAGGTLQNFRLLVCERCYDTPQDQNRSLVLPSDPPPIVNARPEDYQAAETDYATDTPFTVDPDTGIPISNTTVMTTVSGQPMIMQPMGSPKGYTPAAQAPIVAGVTYGAKLPVLSILSGGTPIITVTTSSPHGLSNNAQVGVRGVLKSGAAGVFSVTVNSATQFTYQTDTVIPAGSLLLPSTVVTTMNVGVPYNMSQIPETGS